MPSSRFIGSVFLALFATTSIAQETVIPASAEFMFKGERISIVLNGSQGPANVSTFANASPDCGSACLGPVTLAPGVASLGEREVLAFLTEQVVEQTGLVVDARTPQDRALGYIPGSVSLPAGTMAPENVYQADILRALGAQDGSGQMTFANVRHLMVYDVGPAANDAGVLVQNLLAAGYPADKISYYRGGMLMWAALGLSIAEGS